MLSDGIVALVESDCRRDAGGTVDGAVDVCDGGAVDGAVDVCDGGAVDGAEDSSAGGGAGGAEKLGRVGSGSPS